MSVDVEKFKLKAYGLAIGCKHNGEGDCQIYIIPKDTSSVELSHTMQTIENFYETDVEFTVMAKFEECNYHDTDIVSPKIKEYTKLERYLKEIKAIEEIEMSG